MGLDAERIDLTRYERILSQLSNQETQWIEANVEHKLQLATALWTAKEAFGESSLYRANEPCSNLQFERVQPDQFRKLGRALRELCTVQDYDLDRRFARCVNRIA
jgi:4'-phosphopantetheinyl transferase superfamily